MPTDETFVATPLPGDLVTERACPGCGSTDLSDYGGSAYEGSTLRYQRCSSCSLLFMNPRPTQAWYDRLYQHEFWESKRAKGQAGKVDNQLLKEATWAGKLIALLEEVNFGAKHPNPQILEIGCAFGLIVRLVAERFGGKAFGVEPSDDASRVAETVVGTPMYARNMQQVVDSKDREKFDLVIFSHCLENITNAPEALRAIHRLLKPGGLILIDTPNNFFRRSWHIHHPYCFTAPALEAMLASAGFRTVTRKTWGRPKIALGWLFLSMIAERVEQPESAPRATAVDALKMRLGPVLHRCFISRPLISWNREWGKRRWPLDAALTARVESLRSKLASQE